MGTSSHTRRGTRFQCYPLVMLFVTAAPANQSWGSDTGAGATVRLASADNTVDTVISEVIVRKAYARLGYQVEVTRYPAERALRLADSGRADGDVQRIDGLGKQYPNLIQLYPPINYFEANAFAANLDIHIDDWSSLRPHRIGLIRGIKFAELNTQGMDRELVGDYPALFRMLRNKRFDVALSPRLNGIYQLKRLNISGIKTIEPPIARFDLYHYVHRRLVNLAPNLEAVFRDMHDSGELIGIRQRVVAELLVRAKAGLPLCDEDYACFDSPGQRGGGVHAAP